MNNLNDIEKYRAIPLTEVLGVKETGRRITIRCPIHVGTGKTPSFNIYPDGGYKCYGCGASGRNAIDLCMALGFSFKESLDELKIYL